MVPVDGDFRCRSVAAPSILEHPTGEVLMRLRQTASLVAPLMFSLLAVGHGQQQPSIGVPVPPLGAGPWLFDTAEQHKIRVSVVTKGLSHPWAIAWLSDNDMLISERGGRLRFVRNG